jgi:tRNA1Val (adenine37-N6)-methyltransferase
MEIQDSNDWRKDLPRDVFRFKQFDIVQKDVTMKVNTDAVLLGAWSEVNGKMRALDIGTGTGVIAIMLAQRQPEVVVWGIDVDPVACAEASFNMQSAPFSNRLYCVHAAIQTYSNEEDKKYDLIVSNPPFFSGGTFSSNENKANVRHTVKLSHSDLLSSVRKLLLPGGDFDLILPHIEGLRLIEMAKTYGFFPTHITEVYPKLGKPIERLLIRLSNTSSSSLVSDTLLIHDDMHESGYSPGFRELTASFYPFL